MGELVYLRNGEIAMLQRENKNYVRLLFSNKGIDVLVINETIMFNYYKFNQI